LPGKQEPPPPSGELHLGTDRPKQARGVCLAQLACAPAPHRPSPFLELSRARPQRGPSVGGRTPTRTTAELTGDTGRRCPQGSRTASAATRGEGRVPAAKERINPTTPPPFSPRWAQRARGERTRTRTNTTAESAHRRASHIYPTRELGFTNAYILLKYGALYPVWLTLGFCVPRIEP
jgi:hypothetical protein